MSFFEAIMNFISSLFGGNKPAQPAEQKPAEPQLPGGVEEIVPRDDPRVKASNLNKGLVLSWDSDGKQYYLHYQNGQTFPFNTPDTPDKYIQNGISLANGNRMNYCIKAVESGKDLSEYTEQQIFEAKVWIGRILVR